MQSEKIVVLAKESSNKIKIKGSQFIGQSYPINSQSEAENYLAQIKKQYYDATHHCYAYKLDSGEERYSDDGEPSGTAGIRILNSLNHFNLTNTLLVVIRYFGGTKLGVGPLGKAYGETSMELLFNSVIIELTKFKNIEIIYNYDNVSTIYYLLNKYKVEKIIDKFETSPSINCFIEPSLITNFKDELTQKTSGKASINELNRYIYLRLN